MTDDEVICINDNGIERLILPTDPGDNLTISSDGVFLAETRCCCCSCMQIASELNPEQMIRIAQKLLEWGNRLMYAKEHCEQEGKTTQEAAQS